MFKGSFYCFITFFGQNALLLLGVWSQALEALRCEHQFGRLGETSVLSPGPVNEVIQMEYWEHNKQTVADKATNMNVGSERLSMNKDNYNLTIKELKITDSGEYTFVSYDSAEIQRDTTCTRLIVQEVLAQPPTLKVINITKPSNESCVVLLECSSKYDKNVSYSWTVNNTEKNGSILQYLLEPQGGDITVTCIVSNNVSNTSKSEPINCNSPDQLVLPDSAVESSMRTSVPSVSGILIIAGVAFAVLVSIVVFVIIYRYKKRQASEAPNELTIYEEIDDNFTKIVKPCSIYETRGEKQVKPKAETIYDRIDFSRMQQP